MFLFDLLSLTAEGHLVNTVPTLQQRVNLEDAWTLLWVGSEHVPDQNLHFVIYSGVLLRNEELCVDDSHLLGILERMFVEAECKENAAQHPDIDFQADIQFLVFVDHLWWSIHHGCESLKFLVLFLNLIRRGCLVEQDL